MPEALASYRDIFTDDEQKELGIADMTAKELDNALSDTESPDSAKLQKNMLEKLTAIVNDEENTKLEFYKENDGEVSCYVIWEDDNNDGKQTPEEMHLGQSRVGRNGAPQVDILRRTSDGELKKHLDLNLYCRFQPNTETENPSLPYIPNEEPDPDSGDEKTGDEGTDIKSGGEKTGDEGTDIKSGGEKTGGEKTEGEKTGGEKTEGEKTGGEKTEGEKTGGEKTEGEKTGGEKTGGEKTGDEGTTPKDADNAARIDQKIIDDIKDDVQTDQIIINPTEDITKQEVTEQPTPQEAQPQIQENQSSQEAEQVNPEQVSPENDYTTNQGRQNPLPDTAVQPDQTGQAAADVNEIPPEQAPTGGDDLQNILSDLGIN